MAVNRSQAHPRRLTDSTASGKHRRTAALGVGVEPLPHKKLNVNWLVAALKRVLNDTKLQQRAAEFGSEIRLEDGVGNAVSAIQARL